MAKKLLLKNILNGKNKMNPIISSTGTQSWYKDGKLHRENGPAVILTNGSQFWYKDGKLHRENGPAIIYSDGKQYWFQNDKLHREDGPAVNSPIDEYQAWYKNGKPIALKEHDPREQLHKKILKTTNFWSFVELLTDEFGNIVGEHVDKLLKKQCLKSYFKKEQ